MCIDFENSSVFIDSPEQIRPMGKIVSEVGLYFFKGDRYRQKPETIRDWMAKDRLRQNFFDNTPEPRSIICPKCRTQPKSALKTLDEPLNGPMRMLFFFGCLSCDYKQSIFNNGEVRISKPPSCPKCHHDLKRSYQRTGKVITTIDSCSNCEYKETEIDDLDDKKDADCKLLTDYREKYCFNDKEGTEYITTARQLQTHAEYMRDKEQKAADPAYQQAKNLKKLTITELEELVGKVIAKAKYQKLELGKPEIDRFVIVPFTAQDTDTSRKEYDSENQPKRLLKKALEDTNWRLMSDGISYRLGYVSGKLKGYEKEDDLANLIRTNKS